MIGYVRGRVAEISVDTCFVDVHGVGYRVYISGETRARIAEGEEVRLYTYLNVREDAMQLYGFSSHDEYDLFLMLIGVSGIGPKVAQGILSGMSPTDFKIAVVSDDAASLVKLPGIGKKSADRLVLELKDKFVKAGFDAGLVKGASPSADVRGGVAGEVLAALSSLGYAEHEVADIVRAEDDGMKDVSSLLRAVLSAIGKRK